MENATPTGLRNGEQSATACRSSAAPCRPCRAQRRAPPPSATSSSGYVAANVDCSTPSRISARTRRNSLSIVRTPCCFAHAPSQNPSTRRLVADREPRVKRHRLVRERAVEQASPARARATRSPPSRSSPPTGSIAYRTPSGATFAHLLGHRAVGFHDHRHRPRASSTPRPARGGGRR